ncbi:helix-turn-helix transcriptional regulator [Halomonas binhaiensis]|uniref:LuxR family transcriptional regulator n=1 Tax=Halomonas binhaiensis TaxID=2562282 RepID=A0A856QMN6_9GAMM|nr:LuxR C-terminal-related transcriptional regulator [Halomonas binhaiensis]QEM81197.2 LuxR family transcriptional regulator [Halomonas binhaiensis]
MPTLELLAWHRAFGQLLDKLDDSGFWLSLIRLLRGKADFHTWAVLLYLPHQAPRILAHSGEEEGSDQELFDDYRKGLYLLDPFYVALTDRQREGLYRLDDVAPDCFASTEYYQRYFQRNVVSDEVQFNLALEGGATLALSLGTRQPYSDEAMGLFSLVQPWLLPLMRQRWRHERQRAGTDSDHRDLPGGEEPSVSLAPELDVSKGIRLLDEGVLTERERQVCQLMLGGGSAKSIARKLDISVETVRSHRRHLYHKLGVSTQSELFALFWASYSGTPSRDGG